MNLSLFHNREFQNKIFIITIILFIAGTVTLHFYGPGKTIELVGLTNSYIIAFFMGAFGGSFVLTAGAYYYSIYTIAQHGLNPIILGIVGGTGLTFGDSIFYYLGFRGKDVEFGWLHKKVVLFGKWLRNKPKYVVLLACFIYIAFVPLPNDLLLISSGLAGYSFRLVIIPVLCGNVTFVTLIGMLAQGLLF